MKKIIGIMLLAGVTLFAGECCKHSFDSKTGSLKLEKYYQSLKSLDVSDSKEINVSKELSSIDNIEEGVLLNGAFLSDEPMPIIIKTKDKIYLSEAITERGRGLIRLVEECNKNECRKVEGFIIDKSDMLVGVSIDNNCQKNKCGNTDRMTKVCDMKDKRSCDSKKMNNYCENHKSKYCDSNKKCGCVKKQKSTNLIKPLTKVYIFKK